jgi:hypothetical protein
VFSADKNVKSGVNYSKSQAFLEARETLAPAGAVEYGEYTPPALVLTEPVPGAGKPQYYLAGRMSLAYVGEVVRMMGKNSSGNFGLVDSGGQIIADSMSMSIVRPGIKAPPEVLQMLSLAAGREAGDFSSEVFYHGRVYLASVSAVSGSRWWIYEVMDSADIPAHKTSFWAKRVVFSGILLIIIFAFITHRLALFWLKQ